MTGLRERKKQETRQRLSNLATAMFAERGFDNVSVSEVAEAAGVSKMTVFNYFPRKEDLFFDRNPEIMALLAATVRERPAGSTPLAAVRDLVLKQLDEQHPVLGLADRSTGFWRMILGSPTLRARAREAAEEVEGLLATLFAEAYGEADGRLTAALLWAAWRTAYLSGARRILAGEPAEEFFAEQRAWTAHCLAAVPEPVRVH